MEDSLTKYPENWKELLEDDVKSDLLEHHEDIWTGRFHHSVALGDRFHESKRDTEAYIDQIHEYYANKFARTILYLAGQAKTSDGYKLLVKNAKMKLNIK